VPTKIIHDLIIKCETENINVQRSRRVTGRLIEAIPMGGTFIEKLTRYASLMKHETFSEEQEWRLISKPIGIDNPKYDVKVGPSNPVPFFKLDLSVRGLLPITEIISGPTPHGELARGAAASLLYRKGLRGPDFSSKLSKTPYRNW
jgi:hypothetical protein